MAPEVGTEAPDFTLQGTRTTQDVALSSFRGERNVLVVFYPFAFSGICTGELCAVRDDLGSFQNDDVQILAVSCDHPFALKAWADAKGYEFPLLSDFWPHGGSPRTTGCFNDGAGFAQRGTFLVDRAGRRAVRRGERGGEARDQDGWRRRSRRWPRLTPAAPRPGPGRSRARSSAGEHSVYTRAVAGSNPAAPTTFATPRVIRRSSTRSRRRRRGR